MNSFCNERGPTTAASKSGARSNTYPGPGLPITGPVKGKKELSETFQLTPVP